MNTKASHVHKFIETTKDQSAYKASNVKQAHLNNKRSKELILNILQSQAWINKSDFQTTKNA